MKDFSVCVFICLISIIESQVCDSRSESKQCSEGQICRNFQCIEATRCETECSTPGTECVADYCQPKSCTTTGQCVHGQICSQNLRECVYLVRIPVEMETKVNLHPIHHGTGSSYEGVIWIKGPNNQPIASFGRGTGGQAVYFDEYCTDVSTPTTSDSLVHRIDWESGRTIAIEEFDGTDGYSSYGPKVEGKDCLSSDRVELNTNTGQLALYNVQLADEGYYYCKVNAGTKYAIHLETYVVPKEESIVMQGVPKYGIANDTTVEVTCTVPRIKPQPVGMYLRFNDRRYDSILNNKMNADSGTFQTSANFTVQMSKEDNGKAITCVVLPVFGRNGAINKTVTVAGLQQATIEGLPDIVAEGSTHTVSCMAVEKISVHIALRLDASFIPGGVVSTTIGTTGIFEQTRKEYVISFRQEDNGKILKCTVLTSEGISLTVNKTLNVGYSPTGVPRILPTRRDRLVREKVILTCDVTGIDRGNPACRTFVWAETGRNARPFNRRQTYENKLEFEMVVSLEGNYSCSCKNDFGESQMSAPVELVVVAQKLDTGPVVEIHVSTSIFTPEVVIIICFLIVIVFTLFSYKHLTCKKKYSKDTKKWQV